MVQQVPITHDKAKVLFWRLVERFKQVDPENKTPTDTMADAIETISFEMHQMKQDIHRLSVFKTDRQKRFKAIEAKITGQMDVRLKEIKQIEEKILELEKLHKHYTKHAPEHKEHLKRIKEKITESKLRLQELKPY